MISISPSPKFPRFGSTFVARVPAPIEAIADTVLDAMRLEREGIRIHSNNNQVVQVIIPNTGGSMEGDRAFARGLPEGSRWVVTGPLAESRDKADTALIRKLNCEA